MKEQKRAAKSKAKGKKNIDQCKWPTVVSKSKAGRSQETSGRKKSAIDTKKQILINQLSHLHQPDIILPKFSISLANTGINNKIIINITESSISYIPDKILLQNINLSIYSRDRISIQGDNGSGKSSFVKAILNDKSILKSGHWTVPALTDIGYLDQHYRTLLPDQTVEKTIAESMPAWTPLEVRRHLNDFLFRQNEEINAKVHQLSGGEKARLSLAKIAAVMPRILILDEPTNNLDLETREHVINVLKNYPGAIIAISHDSGFLKNIRIYNNYWIIKDLLCRQ